MIYEGDVKQIKNYELCQLFCHAFLFSLTRENLCLDKNCAQRTIQHNTLRRILNEYEYSEMLTKKKMHFFFVRKYDQFFIIKKKRKLIKI